MDISCLGVLEAVTEVSVGWFLLGSLFLTCRCHRLAVSSHHLPFVGVCGLISSYKDTTGPIGLGSTQRTSFYPNYLLKSPISKFGHILR